MGDMSRRQTNPQSGGEDQASDRDYGELDRVDVPILPPIGAMGPPPPRPHPGYGRIHTASPQPIMHLNTPGPPPNPRTDSRSLQFRQARVRREEALAQEQRDGQAAQEAIQQAKTETAQRHRDLIEAHQQRELERYYRERPQEQASTSRPAIPIGVERPDDEHPPSARIWSRNPQPIHRYESTRYDGPRLPAMLIEDASNIDTSYRDRRASHWSGRLDSDGGGHDSRHTYATAQSDDNRFVRPNVSSGSVTDASEVDHFYNTRGGRRG